MQLIESIKYLAQNKLHSLQETPSTKIYLCSDFVSIQPVSRILIGCQLKAAYLSEIWLDEAFQVLRAHQLFEYGNLD